MSSSFAGKTLVVTGASSGIGRVVAERLVADGADVIALDRAEPTVDGVRHVAVDLADPASVEHAVAALPDVLDAVLYVAGVPGTLPGDVVMAVNVFGLRQLTEALTPRIRQGGAIVLVGSIAGMGWPARIAAATELLATASPEEARLWWEKHPQEGNAYNFSKEVVTVYTMRRGIELVGSGVRINAVLPGPVETPILPDFEDTMGKQNLDNVREVVGRHATAEDIAEVVLFLASDGSRWMNGQPVVVDGGLSGGLATGLVDPARIGG